MDVLRSMASATVMLTPATSIVVVAFDTTMADLMAFRRLINA